MIFDDDGNISFRQSWLDTAFRCAERGRQAVIRPEWDKLSSDSAIIGTATHAAIEARLNWEAGNHSGLMPMQALVAAITDEVAGGVKWTKYSSVGELTDNAIRCYDAWEAAILPRIVDLGLVEGALTEVGFKVPLYTLADGRTVSITGTVDFVPKAPVLWDWKTASQKFRAHEKQKYAIQPTIYTLAAIKGGLRSDVDYSWPMDFIYGIAVRHDVKAVPQILAVRRTEEHALFAIERIKTLTNLALNYGLDKPWPTDDDHFLCSQTWCPWWSICKGAHAISNEQPPGWN